MADLAAWLLEQIAEDEDGEARSLYESDRPRALRLLAECDAKRRIVELHSRGHECSVYDRRGEVDSCCYIQDFDNCSTLRLLAAPYADRPGHLAEWTAEVPHA